MTPAFEDIADLSTRLVAAELRHAKAVAAVAAAVEARDAIAARLADLAGKRQSIVVRRAEGRIEDDDAQALAVLAADVDGLQMLLGQHDAAVADARVPERAAAAAVANARLELRRGEARAVEEAAIARVQAAADALVVDLHLARQVRGELGGGPARWSVPEALWNVLVPLRHNRAW